MNTISIIELSTPYRDRMDKTDPFDRAVVSLAINEEILNSSELEHETKLILSYYMLGYYMGKR